MVASTMTYSMSGSSETASNRRFQTPAFAQSRKRVHAYPVAEGARQIAPRAACAGNPQHGFDKQPVVIAASAGIARLAKTMWFHLRPLGVSQNESVHPKLESQSSSIENPESKQALAQKVSDEFTVPLCRAHHRELHRAGKEREWWSRRGVDPLGIARELWLRTRVIPGQSSSQHDTSAARR
jgi:hypothetical protein